MRLIGRALLGLVLLALIGATVALGIDLFGPGTLAVGPGGPNSTRSTAYRVESARWIEFNLIDDGPVRVLSNCAFAKLTNARLRYSLDYEVLDASNQVVRSGRYQHRTQITLVYDPEDEQNDRPISRTVYAALNLPGGDPSEFRISAADIELPARLRVRLGERDAGLHETSVRVYQRERLSARKRKSAWQRLNRRNRDHLTRGFALASEWLRPPETLALASLNWRPLGPNGVLGEDYREHALRMLNGPNLARYRDTSGLARKAPLSVWPGLRTVVAVVSESAPVRIRFSPMNPANAPATLSVRFIPDDRRQSPSSIDLQISADGTSFEHRGADGWLEFRSEVLLSGEFQGRHRNDPGKWIRLPWQVSNHALDPSTPVEFSVHHADGRSTPLRIDIRALIQEGAEHDPIGDAKYDLVDASGKVIRSGALRVPNVPSRYDRPLRPGSQKARISDAETHFFSAPPEVGTLRIRGGRNVSVAAYSRPHDLAHLLRVPADYRPVDLSGERIPAWFSMRPLGERELGKAGRTRRIVVQPRPREIDPAILAGDFGWESFRAEGDWLGRFLLTPREPGKPVRAAALPSSYLPVSANRSQAIEFVAQKARKRVRPRLIFLRDTSDPAVASVEIDGKLAATETLLGRRGSIQLPATKVGFRNFTVHTTAAARWYISHARGDGARLARQLAARIEVGGTLEFQVVKRDAEELLTLLVRTPAKPGSISRLRVRLLAPESALSRPLTGWTLRDRVFEIEPADGEPVVVLDTATETTGIGQRLFVPLASDLPPGTYRLRVELEEGSEGYVSLFRVKSGSPVVRYILREGAA